MQISQAANAQTTGSMSILKSANKQPELALELIQGALQSLAAVQGAQQASRPVESAEAPDGDGSSNQRIDIRA